jgi:hypothetical protein
MLHSFGGNSGMYGRMQVIANTNRSLLTLTGLF